MKDRSARITSRASLTDQLRGKSRRRREGLGRMADAAASVRAPRNDLLPRLEISYVLLSELRPSARKLRKLDPAHVREVATSISLLGFCVPVLVGKGNAIIDGEARLGAASLLSLIAFPAYISAISRRSSNGCFAWRPTA
jgi:hypothetical protein